MAVSDTAVSISAFLGLNDSLNSQKTVSGEARALANFIVTDDGRLKKRNGYSAASQNAVEGEVLQVVFFQTQTNYNFSFLVLTETALWGYRFQTYNFVKIYDRKKAGRGKCFIKNDKLYLIGGEFTCFDKTLSIIEETPYIPTVAINKSPSGAIYTPFEKENALTDLVSEEFISDGTTPYFLKYKNVSDLTVECRYSVSATLGENGSFTVSPPLPEGVKLKATYRAGELFGNGNEIISCDNAVFFGGTLESDLFLWNSESNRRYYSNGGKVNYFPIDNSDEVGSSGFIYDIVCHYGQMIIFSSSGIYASSLRISENGDVSYPLSLLNDGVRVLEGKAVIANNAPVFLTNSRLEKIASTVEKSEKNVVCLSDRVSATLKRAGFKNVFNIKTKNELWVTADGLILVWNYKNDIFYTLEGISASCIFEQGTEIAFIDSNGYLCKFSEIYDDLTPNGERRPVDAYCYLEGIDFNTPFRKKQLTDIFLKTEAYNGGEISVIGDISEEPITYTIKTGFAKSEKIIRIKAKKERFYSLGVLIRSKNEGEDLQIDELGIAAAKLYTKNRR